MTASDLAGIVRAVGTTYLMSKRAGFSSNDIHPAERNRLAYGMYGVGDDIKPALDRYIDILAAEALAQEPGASAAPVTAPDVGDHTTAQPAAPADTQPQIQAAQPGPRAVAVTPPAPVTTAPQPSAGPQPRQSWIGRNGSWFVPAALVAATLGTAAVHDILERRRRRRAAAATVGAA